MKQKLDQIDDVFVEDNEPDDEIVEEFESLKECIDYYTDILSRLKSGHNESIYTRREYKKKKKLVMDQYDKSLKLLKKKNKHSRKVEEDHLKALQSNSNVPKFKPHKSYTSIESGPTIEPSDDQYTIEDKQD